MDLTHNMRVAREVARLGGFAAAARSLNISAPSVSRIISDLEQDLGVRLFLRTTRQLSLTEEGAMFIQRAGQVLEDIDSLRVDLLEKDRAPRGLLRVTSVVAFGNEVLPGVIARFRRRYPEIDVELDVSNRRVDLLEEHVDVAIRIGSAEGLEDTSMVARRVYSQTLIFVASPEAVDLHGVPERPDDLAARPLVRFVTGRFGRTHLLVGPGGETATFDLPGQFVVNSPLAARNALLEGEYFGLVADYLVTDALASGRLVRVLEGWSTRPQPIFAVHAGRRLMPARVRVFLDFLAEAMGGAIADD
jgi:LysR family transcriptional regulator for bpeEF and oprC